MLTRRIKQGDLGNTLALSCVERLLLYIFEDNKINPNMLFVDSFESVEVILDYFINRGMKYSEFNIFDRLQHIACKKNVIDMRYSEIRDDKFINDYEYILVRANVEFLNKTYGSSIWNKEHYILITQKDKNTYYYLNDNPYDERVISKEMLDELSTKSAIGISLKRELIAGIDELKYFYDKLNKNNNKNKIDFNTSNESCLLQLRDALGVIRVMRKRNYYFISEYIDARFMEEYLKKYK